MLDLLDCLMPACHEESAATTPIVAARQAPGAVTPTAALSASSADPCRAASARSNGPFHASPIWFRRFLLFRHSEVALVRMKSRYSARGLCRWSSYRFLMKMPLNCDWLSRR